MENSEKLAVLQKERVRHIISNHKSHNKKNSFMGRIMKKKKKHMCNKMNIEYAAKVILQNYSVLYIFL